MSETAKKDDTKIENHGVYVITNHPDKDLLYLEYERVVGDKEYGIKLNEYATMPQVVYDKNWHGVPKSLLYKCEKEMFVNDLTAKAWESLWRQYGQHILECLQKGEMTINKKTYNFHIIPCDANVPVVFAEDKKHDEIVLMCEMQPDKIMSCLAEAISYCTKDVVKDTVEYWKTAMQMKMDIKTMMKCSTSTNGFSTYDKKGLNINPFLFLNHEMKDCPKDDKISLDDLVIHELCHKMPYCELHNKYFWANVTKWSPQYKQKYPNWKIVSDVGDCSFIGLDMENKEHLQKLKEYRDKYNAVAEEWEKKTFNNGLEK